MDAQSGQQVIRFSNLRQDTDTVGEYAEVKFKVIPFASSNSPGVLRPIGSLEDIKAAAKADAGQIKRWIASSAV